MRAAIIIGTAALALAILLPAAAPARSGAACLKVCHLQRQNAALKRTNTALRAKIGTLNGQVSTLTGERDTARSQLAQAQSGVAGALSTMAPAQIWPLFGNPIAYAYSTAQWSKSYYSNGSDYESWSFTRCGFC
jgi:hypothetical protein